MIHDATYLSSYRIMWIILFFDLPTTEQTDKKNYIKFRHFLQNNGFHMAQYSVYSKCVPSKDVSERVLKDIEKNLPPYGSIQVMTITDKQYEHIINFTGKRQEKPEEPQQYMLF